MKKLFFLGLSFFCFIATNIYAQNNLLFSCYNENISEEKKVSDTELFVIIDQTTQFDNQLKQQIVSQVLNFIQPGNSINFIVFSSFSQGKYTQVVSSFRLEHRLSEKSRANISKPLLAKFDKCFLAQPVNAAKISESSLRYAFEGTSSDLSKSDIFFSLKEISGMIAKSSANAKVVLIASDMLENSSISSFYDNKSVRLIDPNKELLNIEKLTLFGNFNLARIYIIGTGLIPEDLSNSKYVYRDPKTLQALSNFWELYFKKSNAQVVEIGKPALLNPIK